MLELLYRVAARQQVLGLGAVFTAMCVEWSQKIRFKINLFQRVMITLTHYNLYSQMVQNY